MAEDLLAGARASQYQAGEGRRTREISDPMDKFAVHTESMASGLKTALANAGSDDSGGDGAWSQAAAARELQYRQNFYGLLSDGEYGV